MKLVYLFIGILIISACMKNDLKTEKQNDTKKNKAIINDETLEGTWFNSSFSVSIRKSNSIYHVIDNLQYYPIISFHFNSDTLNYFCGSLTEGATSRLNIDSLFVIEDYECICVNNENLTTFCFKNNQLLLTDYQHSIPKVIEFIKISNKYQLFDSLLQSFLCLELFEGRYIDLGSKDTVIISNNRILYSENKILHFIIGLEFLSIPYDFIKISDSSQVSSKFYHFKFEENVLILKLLEYDKITNYYKISNKNTLKLYKI